MSAGPLNDPRLKLIEECLDGARFEEAQYRLSELNARASLGPGIVYLTTRLLYQRGRLDDLGVADRLRDIVRECETFPEAHAMLAAAENGSLVPDPEGFRNATQPPLADHREGARENRTASLSASGKVPPAPALPRLELDAPLARENSGAFSLPPLVLEGALFDSPSASTSSVQTIGRAVTQPATGGTLATMPVRRERPPESTRSPTLPAPPPDQTAPESDEMLSFRRTEPPTRAESRWDPLETALVAGRSANALTGLDRLAAARLDALLGEDIPSLERIALEAVVFLNQAPITRYFAPFDLSHDSIERVEAAFLSFGPTVFQELGYAGRVMLVAYLGECVRLSLSGHWEGSIVEPESLCVESESGRFAPAQHLLRSFLEGTPLVRGAGPKPHPGAEPPDYPELDLDGTVALLPWPSLTSASAMGRSLHTSVIGRWALQSAGTGLDMSWQSITAIDAYLDLLSPRARPPTPDARWARRAVVLTGSYLGEVLVAEGGGRWRERERVGTGPEALEVELKNGAVAAPLRLAQERLTRTKSDPIAERVAALLR
jgi:hypothetical protein